VPEPLTADSFFDGGRRVVKLVGDIDLATAPIARDALSKDFDAIDFSELAFLDSTGVQVLVEACQGRAVRTSALGLHGQALRILELTGLSDMFVIEHAVRPDSVPLQAVRDPD
jgi:anti-sigma B factor antagonist